MKVSQDNETKRDRVQKLRAQLKNKRSTWEPHYKDVEKFLSPRRTRFHTTEANQAMTKQNNAIVNNTALLAIRTLRSGMHSGITSPARPWFRLTTPDPSMNEFGPVKQWLHEVTARMQTVFHRSNLYNALPTIYGDCGAFGTAAATLLEDDDDVIRLYTYPVGSYYIATSNRGNVDTLAREFRMTVRQMVQEFGIEQVSQPVRDAYKNGQRESWRDIVQLITPNDDYDPDKLESKFKRFSSLHMELCADANGFLRESGFDESPIIAPRWDLTGEDIYGVGPGLDCMGDAKALQLMERRKAQAIDKMVNPPLVGGTGLRNSAKNTQPGGVTYVDDVTNGFKPLYEVNFDTRELREDIFRIEQRINSTFFADLFLMIANSGNRNMTATEVAERHEEKLLMLGPVLERLNDELLNPIIDRTFAIMMRNGLLPMPPEEIQGVDLRVEHISILAQAQKMVATSAIDRFSGFIGQVANIDQSVLDKIDTDALTDEYSDMMGVPPNIVRTTDQANQIRQQRAEQMEAQQQQERAAMAVEQAKTLSETKVNDDSALDEIMKNMGA